MTLSWSRALYLEFFYDQTMENFLRGHVNAFRSFQGSARILLYDNLKSAVLLPQALADGESAGRQIAHLLQLLDRYGARALCRAVREALDHNTPRAASVEFLLRQSHRTAPLPLDLRRHPQAESVDVHHTTWRPTMNSPNDATKTPSPNPDLREHLERIGLTAVAAQLDGMLAHASKQRWSPRQLLEQLASIETVERAHRSLERRLRSSEIRRFKPMADFEWSWPKRIERDVIERAMTLDSLAEARNLCWSAPTVLARR